MAFLPFNRPRFLTAVYQTEVAGVDRFNIGTYKEKTLHRVLKRYYAEDAAEEEVPVDRFIADVRSPDGIIEIQTSGLSSMRDKLEVFLPDYPVTVVVPVAVEAWITLVDPESGTLGPRRKSPKKGRLSDVLAEMVYILPFLSNPKLKIHLVLLQIDEFRVPAKNRRGVMRYNRVPIDIIGIYEIASLTDVLDLLPPLPEQDFTAKELSAALKLRGRKASGARKVLSTLGVICRVEGALRPYRYRLNEI